MTRKAEVQEVIDGAHELKRMFCALQVKTRRVVETATLEDMRAMSTAFDEAETEMLAEHQRTIESFEAHRERQVGGA